MDRIARVSLAALAAVSMSCAGTEAGRGEAERTAEHRVEASTPPPAPRASAPRIVFLGDSLTAGYGLPKEEAVPALIQARLVAEGYDYEVFEAGVSGDTSAGGLSRLEWSLDGGNVEVLVIELGGNDGLRGLPPSGLKANLAAIITNAKAADIDVLLTGMEAPPNFGPTYTSEFREVFSELAREHEVELVPFYLEGVAGIPSLNLPDGIHPNAAGSRVIEGTIWKALEPMLDRPTGRENASR